MTDPRYSVLFEPVRIGPVTARNRFYQVPHCTGLGHIRPRADAATRAVKAEGGWAVLCNQETEIHPTSDLVPAAEGRLWDDRDIPALRLMTEQVHEHGSLAAVELVHNGNHAFNNMTRAPILSPSDAVADVFGPQQARALDLEDIATVRGWYRAATQRSLAAGFDIVYVYAGHRMSLLHQFLLPQINNRTDAYGGSLENRARLLREVLEETLEACEGRAAVAMRLAVDEMRGPDGMQAGEEGRAVVEMLADLPDLWDVNVSDWANDSATSRFAPDEGYQIDYMRWVKDVTKKPVVGVGRFTSPDRMVSMVKSGVLDFIGAARPSIADPFLPKKIEEGRIEEIRECIGCNICVSADNMNVGIRCTQNPTMGEEWRRGWHPERIAPKGAQDRALVVGAGPAGLECAMQLARRGYEVTLAEAGAEAGGRVRREGALSGLSAWKRVMDYRLYDLSQRANVNLYTESRLDLFDVIGFDAPNVFVATGAAWRRDGVGRHTRQPVPVDEGAVVLTPDDIMDGTQPPDGTVLIYDDDQAYMGGVLAETLLDRGYEVTLVTTAAVVSPWMENTLEQHRIQARLIERDVRIIPLHGLAQISEGTASLTCVYSGRRQEVPCSSVVMVTEKTRETALYDALRAAQSAGEAEFTTLELIGDADQPGLIADAVFSGHMAARYFEAPEGAREAAWYRREMVDVVSEE